MFFLFSESKDFDYIKLIKNGFLSLSSMLLFIHIKLIDLFLSVFFNIIMDTSNFKSHLKNSTFKKLKDLLYKKLYQI